MVLRICYVSRGRSIHTQRWIRWFLSKGHNVSLITDEPSEICEIRERDVGYRTDSRPRLARYRDLSFNVQLTRPLSTILRLRRLVKEMRPDILHLHSLYFPSNLAIYTGFHPMVMTPWNGDITWSKKNTKLRTLFIRCALKQADLITVDSQELKEQCLKRGVAEDKIRIVQWGVELDIFHPVEDKPALRRELGLGQGPMVLSTRALGEMYNIDVLIEAAALVLERNPGASFVLTWPSEQKLNQLRQLAETLKVSDSIHFLGHIAERAVLAKYYAVADVYVTIASGDTTPVSLLEAMACGIAPVASDLPSIREWIIDGWNGILVPPRDVKATAEAIINLLLQEDQRKMFAQRNINIIAQRANQQIEMAKMERLYLSLLNQGMNNIR
jgi:glycosyltransferase involved in cell wall biosynthesis